MHWILALLIHHYLIPSSYAETFFPIIPLPIFRCFMSVGDLLCPDGIACMNMGSGYSLQYGQFINSFTTGESETSFPQLPLPVNSLSGKSGVSSAPPLPQWNRQIQSCISPVHSHSYEWACECINLVLSRGHCFRAVLPHLCLLESLCPLFRNAPWACGVEWCRSQI